MFKGKNVLVTGSARNTGLGIAQVFGSYGATVFVNGRPTEPVDQVVERLNYQAPPGEGRYLAAPADVTSEDEVRRLFALIGAHGGLDVLVNNACHLGLGHSFLTMPMGLFDEVLAVNLRGYALCAQHAARQMVAKGGGAIVNIGSLTARRAIPNRVAYIASKGAVESLTRAIALELAEYQIRVNCVIPGYIHTDRWDTASEEDIQRRRRIVPLGRESTPKDIGEAVAFLASSNAGSITGSLLQVSGGVDIQMVPRDGSRARETTGIPKQLGEPIVNQ